MCKKRCDCITNCLVLELGKNICIYNLYNLCIFLYTKKGKRNTFYSINSTFLYTMQNGSNQLLVCSFGISLFYTFSTMCCFCSERKITLSLYFLKVKFTYSNLVKASSSSTCHFPTQSFFFFNVISQNCSQTYCCVLLIIL